MTIFPGTTCRPTKRSSLVYIDCFNWLKACPNSSIHAIVTDPPYGLLEYEPDQQEKLREGKGGVWRQPSKLGGHLRSPVPRFTVLSKAQRQGLYDMMHRWAQLVLPAIVPGAHVFVASQPLLSHIVARALEEAGLEKRGEIIRLVQTLRGGDRPKGAETEFPHVSVMPRSKFEPWLLFRRPCEGRVQDNLRKWGTGGLRRSEGPFTDMIESGVATRQEHRLAPHPSLKPQHFLRQIVWAALPLGQGIILDTFAGSGSTLAAAEASGYESIGLERDESYFKLAQKAIPQLACL